MRKLIWFRGAAAKKHVFGAFFLVWCVALLPTRTPAQDLANISGSVTDPQHAYVPSAVIDVENTDTGTLRSTETDSTGHFRVSSLAVGNYEVRAHKDGFSTTVRQGVHLVVGQDATVDLSLQLGSATEQALVLADAPTVSVTGSDVSGLVGEQQVKELPLNGRSYDLLVPLNPGVVNFTW